MSRRYVITDENLARFVAKAARIPQQEAENKVAQWLALNGSPVTRVEELNRKHAHEWETVTQLGAPNNDRCRICGVMRR